MCITNLKKKIPKIHLLPFPKRRSIMTATKQTTRGAPKTIISINAIGFSEISILFL